MLKICFHFSFYNFFEKKIYKNCNKKTDHGFYITNFYFGFYCLFFVIQIIKNSFFFSIFSSFLSKKKNDATIYSVLLLFFSMHKQRCQYKSTRIVIISRTTSIPVGIVARDCQSFLHWTIYKFHFFFSLSLYFSHAYTL